MSVTKEVLRSLGAKATGLVPRLSVIVAGIGVCLMMALVVAQLITRNLLHGAIPFAEEYSLYLVPVVGVIGAAYTLRKEGHVRVDLFLRHLSGRTRQWVVLLGYVLGLGFLAVISKQTFALALLSIEKGYRYMSPMETLIGYPQLLLAVGLWLFALQLVIEIVRKARLLFLSHE